MAKSTLHPKEKVPLPELLASLRDPLLLDFLEHLRSAGFAEKTLRDKRSILAPFIRWVRCNHVAFLDLGEAHLTTFLEGRSWSKNSRWGYARSLFRGFLAFLREAAGKPKEPQLSVPTAGGELLPQYLDYLREERGLTEQTVYIYTPFARAALTGFAAASGSTRPIDWNAEIVNAYLLERARNRSSEYARLLATTLRSLLRFLYLRGEVATDLSLSVSTVRKWSLASVPIYLTPVEVERVLAVPDRSTPRGRRDYAVLILLARLGLRAGEVVTLELGDILWRTGEIVVRGKGRLLDRLPLPPDAGEALATYLKQDRRGTRSRRVFLRDHAPLIGLTGPATVGHIVRKVLAKAGILRTSRGAAHIFRHSLATRMVQNGASIPEISEVLRHRSLNTTGIYAKVAFEALRGVARPWPRPGGAR